MRDLKDSYSVPLDNYTKANYIQDEPAFAWWVPFTLKKQTSIVKKIKSKYHQRTHKYIIRIPENVQEAQDIDTVDRNTLWMDSVRMEMKNNRVALETYQGKI